MQHPIETHIVWLNEDFEDAQEVAMALNGQTIFTSAKYMETVQQLIARFVQEHLSCPQDVISRVQPIVEYIHDENVHEIMPCQSYNSYTAAVFISTLA